MNQLFKVYKIETRIKWIYIFVWFHSKNMKVLIISSLFAFLLQKMSLTFELETDGSLILTYLRTTSYYYL